MYSGEEGGCAVTPKRTVSVSIPSLGYGIVFLGEVLYSGRGTSTLHQGAQNGYRQINAGL